MTQKYSTEWVREESRKAGALGLDHHHCSICNEMVSYMFAPEGADTEVYFKSACGCSWSPPRPSSWREIAEWLAMQSSDDIRERIWSGLQIPAALRSMAEG